jgi:hypothetical protein
MPEPASSDGTVRPTRRCLQDLGLKFPPLEEPISGLDHPLVRHAQRVPAEVDAGGAERIRALADRVWFKCKTMVYRAAATQLTASETASRGLPSEGSWWIGAAGVRQADSKDTDFYRQIEAEALRRGKGTGTVSTAYLLPQQADVQRYLAETALRAVQVLRLTVVKIIAMSFKDGRPYQAEIGGQRVTAVVRAADPSEAYLAITAEGIPDPRVIAVILDAVPGITREEWLPEPGGAAGINPAPGQIIWSAIIPPESQEQILRAVDALTGSC